MSIHTGLLATNRECPIMRGGYGIEKRNNYIWGPTGYQRHRYKLRIISLFQTILSTIQQVMPKKTSCRQKFDFYLQYYYTQVARIAKSAFLFQPFSHFLTASRSNHRLLLLLYMAPLECVKVFQSCRVIYFLTLFYETLSHIQLEEQER